MVNIWKDRNLRQFKMRKEGEPSSSTALKFLFGRYCMNLNKIWMIMVIIHTNNLARKLLYQPFCFQHVVKTARHLLPPLTWGWRLKVMDILLQNGNYGTPSFWTCPHSNLYTPWPGHWYYPSASPIFLFCSPSIIMLVLSYCLFLFSVSLLPNSLSLSSISIKKKKCSAYSLELWLDRGISVPEIC